MLRTALLFGICSLIGLALAAQLALADYSSGFEAGEVPPAYIGAATTPPEPSPQPSSDLPGQENWVVGFKRTFNVYTYPGLVDWTPEVEGPTSTPAPPNPTGGGQYAAHGSQGRTVRPNTGYTPGLVEVSADYAAGYKGDYNPRQGQLRYGDNAGGGRVGNIGISAYTCDAYDGAGGDDGTEWAWNLDCYDINGVEIKNNENYYRFNDVTGFDNLTREKWYRMGIVVDLDPGSATYRRILQLKSQDITGGQIWIMDNPQGPLGEDMYMYGGANGTILPNELGIYNVGNGSLSMFDNVYVGAPYDWSAASTDTYTWEGGADTWAATNWEVGGATQQATVNGNDMVIDHALDNSVVTVAAGNPSTNSVAVGATNDATLIVNSGQTLSASGAITVGPNGTLAGEGAVSASTIGVSGTVAPGTSIGTLTVSNGTMTLTGTLDAELNAQATSTGAADKIVVSNSGAAMVISGSTLKVTGIGRGSASAELNSFGNFTRAVIESSSPGNPIMLAGEKFLTTDPVANPVLTQRKDAHIGDGAFLRGVTYNRPGGAGQPIDRVDVELFIAKGGDTDGDGTVHIFDWFNFRPNFDPSGTGMDWTDGDFDGDGTVHIKDWFIFRPNFSSTAYFTSDGPEGGASAVPEPGTLAMLLAGLIGLGVTVWRRR